MALTIELGLDRILFELDIPCPKFLKFNNKSYSKYWKVSENKSLELQIEHNWDSLFWIDIDISRKCDHAGINFSACLFKKMIHINFYDNRHWNYTKNKWEVPKDRNIKQ